MKIFFLVLLFTMILSNITYALDPQLKKKYPFLLLTEDHGIIKEDDLAVFAKNMNYEKFSKKHSGLVYWQCFPREQISITLRDMGYTVEEFEPTDTMSDLIIVIHSKPGILHTYSMRRSYPISVYQNDFIKWQKLMKGEEYVCLAGNFVSYEENIKNGVKMETNSWIFDELKTKKGYSSFFHH